MKQFDLVLYWLPRAIALLAILLVSMFALDAFDPQLTLIQQILGFLVHMIPSFILIGILVLAWVRELSGGLVFLFLGILFTPILFWHNFRMNDSIGTSLGVVALITLPFVLVGVLFIWHYFRTKHERHHPVH